MSLPPFTASGDLPPGIHRATLAEALERFGSGSPQRMLVGLRLERVYNVAWATGHLARCVVFGSFVTAKLLPNDVDVFLLMEDTFDMAQLTGEARLLFEHAAAQTRFGASVFWCDAWRCLMTSRPRCPTGKSPARGTIEALSRSSRSCHDCQ